jgi:hypothetical protein
LASKDRPNTPPVALTPAERAEAELWAKASPHERAAAMLVGKATGQEKLPAILAELLSVAPQDALEARLAALALALSHAAVENLSWARVVEHAPGDTGARARLAAVRLAEASVKAMDALGRRRAGGATEHKVVVTHTGPAAAELAVGVRLNPKGREQEDGRRPHAPAAADLQGHRREGPAGIS